jgi:putative ABC transport system permease protein
MNALGQDIRFALRGLRRNAGFALVAVLTLGIGIGANSAIFTVVDSVLLRPLPYGAPDGIVTVLHGGRSPVAPANYLDWRRESRSFQHTAAAQVGPARGTLSGRGRSETLGTMNVTADLFQVLGVPPLHGRTFRAGEDQPGAAQAAVLSHRLWQRRFGGDPAIVGQTLTIDGRNHTVIGIMPPGFEFPPFWARNAELWLPLDLSARVSDRNGESLRVFARLAPGVTRAQAQAETTKIWQRLEGQFPGLTKADVAVVPLHEKAVGHVRRPLLVLLAGVGFVLLIACANVANLLLARSAGRRKEMVIRASLGAGRGRLVRQLLTESVVLWLLGGALGILLAQAGVDLLLAIGPRDLPRFNTVSVDGAVLLFTLGVSLATGVLFGLAPALRLARTELRASVQERGGKVRAALVASQVAMALVLLMAAGLMIRSFQRLRAVDAGFDPAGVVALNVPLPAPDPLDRPSEEVRARGAARRRAFVEDLLGRLRALPGVTAASVVNHVPLVGDFWLRGLEIEGAPSPPPGHEPRAVYRVSAPGYLATMGMALVRGRDFSARDAPGAPGVAIINETMARSLWPGEDPLGKRIRVRDGGPDPRQIVGVVRDVRQRDWAAAVIPEMYLAYLQNPSTGATVVVRAAAGAGALAAVAAEVQRQMWAVDPTLPASRLEVMERVVSQAIGQPRFQLLLLNLFAAVALLLAAVGLYGVIAYAVSRRTRELGIRLALGASARHVVRMVVGEGMALIAVGVVVGVAAALAATRSMQSLLYGIGATDPLTFALVPLLLAGVGLVACWIPARRATRIDPMVALRQE